jgi:hypothetical protein
MRIPEIADRLRDLAAERGLPELAGLADELRRRPAQRGPRSARPMSEQLADEIRAFKREHPGMSQVAISRRFNVNQGRISEALKGKRA